MSISFSQSIVRVCVGVLFASLVCFGFGNTAYASAEYTTFSPDISLNPSCQVVVVFDLVITPATITAGNTFFLNVRKIEGGATVGSQDFPLAVPANGEIQNQEITSQSLLGPGDYRLNIIENNPNQQLISQSSIVNLQIPADGNCNNQNTQQENQNVNNTTNTTNTLGSMAIPISNPINIPTIPFLIQKALELVLKIGIPLLVVMIIYSGALYLFAQGNPSKIASAHTMFLYTLLGGAILLGAWGLSELIYATLIEISAFIPHILS